MYSSKNHSICSESEINIAESQYGIITSPNYPKWTPNTKCSIKLIGPKDNTIRVYISDLNTEKAYEESKCRLGHLTLISGSNSKEFCGDKLNNGDYIFLSCSNSLEVSYSSSGVLSMTYRGFNLYYEGNLHYLR